MKKIRYVIFTLMFVTLLLLGDNYKVYAALDDYTKPDESITENGFRYKKLEDNTIEITWYNNLCKDVVIPDTIDGLTVTSIGESAFYVDNITSVTIPASVKFIKGGAFEYCDELEKVIFLGDGLESIGREAFHYCSQLTDFTFPNTVREVSDYAFYSTSFTEVKVPDYITKWGEHVFSSSKVKTIIFGNGVTKIPNGMFSECDNLKKVIIPKTIKQIGKDAFFNCSNLTSVSIPNDNTKIGDSAFYGNSKLIITCKAGSKVHKYANSENIKVKLTGPYMNKKSATITVGFKEKLAIKNIGKNKVVWKSTNPKVVTVTSTGSLKGIKPGKATITAKSNGKTYTCKVTVRANSKVLETITTDYRQYLTDKVYLSFRKIYKSGSNYIIKTSFMNNTPFGMRKIRNFKIQIYIDGKLFTEKMINNSSFSILACTTKSLEFKLSAKDMKNKNIDLRNASIRVDFTGGEMQYIYY